MTRHRHSLDIEELRRRLRKDSAGRAGMILIHNGIVRGTSRHGVN